MKKEKDINYYRSLLHKDNIVLLVIAVVFTIINILFMGNDYDEAVPIILKSIMFIIISIIIICNKKEIKKFVGTLSMITSCLMILTSIGDSSLFGIVYLLLGIFLGIHSILYLKKFSNYNIQTNTNEVIVKDNKIKYISLIPILITIVLVILGFIFNESLIGLSWCSISILGINFISIILCIILHHKKIKSVLVYIILVISIIITLFSGIFLIEEIKQNIRKNNYYDSEEFLIEYAKILEEQLQDITQVSDLKKLNIDISKVNIITLNDIESILSKNIYAIERLEEHGYTCNGYTILEFKEKADKDYYNSLLDNNDYYNYTMKSFFDIKSYVSCTGKHSYTTDGFNENKKQ